MVHDFKNSVNYQKVIRMPTQKKFKNWNLLIYPENVSRETMLEVLLNLHIPVCISPLHTPDDKKPHYHVIIQYPSPISSDYVLGLVGELRPPKPQPCLSVMGMWRYLQHLDSPEKQQFVGDQRTYLSGFKVPETEDDGLRICEEIVKISKTKNMNTVRSLILVDEVPNEVKRYAIRNPYLVNLLMR